MLYAAHTLTALHDVYYKLYSYIFFEDSRILSRPCYSSGTHRSPPARNLPSAGALLADVLSEINRSPLRCRRVRILVTSGWFPNGIYPLPPARSLCISLSYACLDGMSDALPEGIVFHSVLRRRAAAAFQCVLNSVVSQPVIQLNVASKHSAWQIKAWQTSNRDNKIVWPY